MSKGKDKKEEGEISSGLSEGIPKDVEKNLKALKGKLEKFQKRLLDKFEGYVMGIALLPPEKKKEGGQKKDEINVLVLMDDADSKKMSKEEIKDKLFGKLWLNPSTSISIKKHNAKIMQGWLMALAMKFEIIKENHLASKYRRMAYRLKDVFRGGVSF